MLRHDLDRLAQLVASTRHESTSIESMSTVPARDVLEVALRIAGPEGVAVLRR